MAPDDPAKHLVRIRTPSCPRCRYPDVMLSRRRPFLPLRLVGFKYFRCLGCMRRFLAWYPGAVPPTTPPTERPLLDAFADAAPPGPAGSPKTPSAKFP
jgi:hypothetical protein